MTAWEKTMASREELMQSIQPGMKLDKAFFLKVYGYEIGCPGFRDTAIKALEDAGCSRARDYYDSIVSEYEKGYRKQIKEAGKWYLKECEKKRKGSGELRKESPRVEKKSRMQNWMELSKILNFQPTEKAQ